MSTKKPQDRKPKKSTVETVEGGKKVTHAGKTIFIADDAIDDWELLDDLSEVQNGNGSRVVSVAKRLFGDEYKKVIEQFRNDNGRVKATEFSKFVQEVFILLNPSS